MFYSLVIYALYIIHFKKFLIPCHEIQIIEIIMTIDKHLREFYSYFVRT